MGANDSSITPAFLFVLAAGFKPAFSAYALNFPTQSAFGKYFKQQVGVGPKRYRAEA